MSIPYYPGSLYTPVLGLSLFGMDEVLAENMVILDAAYGAGSSIFVNGTLVASPNLNGTLPAAPAGKSNVIWQYDSNGNVSAYTTGGGGSGAWATLTGDMTETQVAPWDGPTVGTPDTGISRTSAGTLAIGNGSAGDFSGTLKATIVNAVTGFQINGAATLTQYLRGNGTDFVSSAIQAADVPTLNQNTTGTAANLSGTPALPNGTTATTQVATDATTLIATDAFVQNAIDEAASSLGIPWFNLIDALDYNQVVPWYNGSPFAIDTGISRISAGVLGIGTGAQGSITGTLKAAIVNAGTGFQINNTATSGQYLRGNGTNFVSSAIQAGDIPSGTVLWNQIGNPTGNLTLTGYFNTTFNSAGSTTWEWANTTAATSITTNMSPTFIWQANYWDGSVSRGDNWTIQSGLTAGTNGVTTLQIAHGGSAGNAYLSLQNSVEGIQFISSSASLDFGPNSSWVLNLTNGSGNTNNGNLNVVSGTSLSLQAGNANPQLELLGYVTTSAVASVLLENNGNFTGTSGTQKVANTNGAFSPTSGTATFVGHQVHVTVDQTGTASGSYEALLITATETALLGSSNLLILAQAGSAGTTTKFSVDNSGNVVNTIGTTSAIANSPSLTLTGSYESSASGPTYAADSWSIQDVLQAATLNGTSTLTFTHSGSSGAASVSVPSLTCSAFTNASGNMTFAQAGTIYFEFHNGATFSGGSATTIGFSSSTNPTSATPDTAISRVSAGILGIGTGAQGSIAGSIQCSSIALNGAVASPTAGVYYSGTNAGITQTAEAVGTLATTGGIVTTFTAVSDERLKTAQAYKGGLKEILAITPIKYRWNETGAKYSGQSTERDFIGFSAQDVRRVIPEATWISKDDYLGFDDRPVIAALVNAVKMLSEKNKALEDRLEKIEKLLEV